MDAATRLPWLRPMLLMGVVYLVAGVTSAALAKAAASEQMRVAWRLAAWVISAAAFGGHIWYEHVRLRSSRAITAFHAALAAALGAFGLAVAATVHAQVVGSMRPAYALALVLWPVLTGVPAFIVALAVAAVAAARRAN
ncbi:MAG TPA: hypothetical protein VM716_12145 [Gemmatimonadales bacterium]|nr:hypothetical protein [Gemmatimonadales bacterium]